MIQMRPTRRVLLVFSLLLRWMPYVGSSTPSALSSNQHSFAHELTKALYSHKNECTSSLGISMSFSLIYPGGDVTAQEQMQRVFGYPSDESHRRLVWNETQHRLVGKCDDNCAYTEDSLQQQENSACEIQKATLKIANRVYLADSFIVGDNFRELLGPYIFQMNFDSGDAGSVVNNWVSQSTRGLVETIVPDGPMTGVLLIALNAIYLKASWMHQFAKEMTNVDSFYESIARSTALPSKVNFMHTVNNFPYSDTAVPNHQILQMRFQDATMSMIMALPTKGNVRDVDFRDIRKGLAGMENTKVAVALPKFKFESVYDENLMSSLKKIGLTAPFERGLCFGGEGGCIAKVTKVIQKTVIDVNEEGVEAAAASAVVVDRSAPPPDVPVLFLADHPFQFFIYEHEEDLVLIEGRVSDPGISYDVQEPALDAKHDDPDFWIDSFNVDPKSPKDDSSAIFRSTMSNYFVVVVITAIFVRSQL